jgi:uncharacterized protein YdhG (YjbR/CyaY superfamily)
MNSKPADIDEYLAGVPDDARATLEQVRGTVKAVAPAAVESISYGMPAFRYRGQPLVYFAAAKEHCALYGIDEDAHKEELAGYDTSSKGTIRFPPGQPPPESLMRTLLSARIEAIDAAAGRKRKKPGGPTSA